MTKCPFKSTDRNYYTVTAMRSCTNRELRLILYSLFAGAMVASIVWQIVYHRPKTKTRTRCPPGNPPVHQDSQEKACPQCPKIECPKHPSADEGTLAQVPKTLKSFLSRHWEVMHDDAVVIVKTRMKSF